VSVEEDERSDRPGISKTTENVEKIRELIHEDRRRTIHELADKPGISYGVCQEILTENLNMRRICDSSQRDRPHVPENHRDQQHGYRSPASLLAGIIPL
jgi:ribosomal protein S25